MMKMTKDLHLKFGKLNNQLTMKQLLDFFFNENFFWKIILTVWALLTSFFSQAQVDEIPNYHAKDMALHKEIVKMDSIYFNAYNTCDMKTQEALIDEDLEFFHDNGGLSTSKKDILISLKNNICDKVTRTLIKGSVEVYPIPNYGAIQMGYHKFFNEQEPNAKSVPSKFVTIWKKGNNNSWTITRVISLH